MKYFSFYFLFLFIVLFFSGCGDSPKVIQARYDKINKIKKLSVLRVFIQDVMVVKIKGSKTKKTYIIRGSALYSVDFSKAEQNEEKKEIILDLPEITPKVENDGKYRMELYNSEKGFWEKADGSDKISKVAGYEAQKRIEKLVNTQGNMSLAKQQAEKLLAVMFKGYTVSWRTAR